MESRIGVVEADRSDADELERGVVRDERMERIGAVGDARRMNDCRLLKQEFGELMCSQAVAKYSDMELEVLQFAELSKEKDFIRGKHVNSVGTKGRKSEE